MLKGWNQIHNYISSSGSGTVINYGSGSGSKFLTSYGSGSGSVSNSQKVTVPIVPVPVPQRCLQESIDNERGSSSYPPPASSLRLQKKFFRGIYFE